MRLKTSGGGGVVTGRSSDPLGLSEMVGPFFSQSSVQYLELFSSILFSSRKRIHGFLLDAFIQGLVYTFNTVPVDTGVRRKLLYFNVCFSPSSLQTRVHPVVQ